MPPTRVACETEGLVFGEWEEAHVRPCSVNVNMDESRSVCVCLFLCVRV